MLIFQFLEKKLYVKFHFIGTSILSNVKYSEITRGRTTSFSVSNNCDLDVLFGEGWDYRIENLQGDSSYVTQGTASFHLKKVSLNTRL